MGVQTRNISGQSASPDRLSAHFIRQVRNFMNNWVVDGGEFYFDGYRARLRILGGGSQSATPRHPFQVTRDDLSDPATTRVSVRPGTINSLVPTNIFSPLTITATGTEYVVLTASTTDGTFNSATLSIETVYPVPSSTTPEVPPTLVKDVIAVLNDGVVFQCRDDNLTATSLEVFQESITSPSPGERQYTPWYRWEISES